MTGLAIGCRETARDIWESTAKTIMMATPPQKTTRLIKRKRLVPDRFIGCFGRACLELLNVLSGWIEGGGKSSIRTQFHWFGREYFSV